MADCSGAREPRMGGGQPSATRRQKKFSDLWVLPSSSGKSESRTCCRTLTTISPSGISGVGKSTAAHSERVQTASIAESTVLPSGVSEAQPHRAGSLRARAHQRRLDAPPEALPEPRGQQDTS